MIFKLLTLIRSWYFFCDSKTIPWFPVLLRSGKGIVLKNWDEISYGIGKNNPPLTFPKSARHLNALEDDWGHNHIFWGRHIHGQKGLVTGTLNPFKKGF